MTDEVKVRIYGDAAAVTGRDTVKKTKDGQDVSHQERWTDTWIKREGQWLCAPKSRT
jgi:hypothetical protein